MKRPFRSLIKIILVSACALSLNLSGYELTTQAEDKSDPRTTLSSHFNNQKKRRRTRRRAQRRPATQRTEFTVNTDTGSSQPRIIKGSPDYISSRPAVETTDVDVPLPPAQPTPPPKTLREPIHGGVLNGKALNLPRPIYPAIARAAGASGTVVVKIIIDESGRVISARAVSGHPLLRAAAVEAAYAARFSPTQLSGQPVKIAGTLLYNFVKKQTRTAQS